MTAQFETMTAAPRRYEELLTELRGPGNGLGDLYRVDLNVVAETPPP